MKEVKFYIVDATIQQLDEVGCSRNIDGMVVKSEKFFQNTGYVRITVEPREEYKKIFGDEALAESYDIPSHMLKPIGGYRVGKKQERAVLDADGHEVAIFHEKYKHMAKFFCDFINSKIL